MLVTVFEDTLLYQPTFFFFLYKPAIMFKGYGFISPFPSLYMDKLFSCLCLSVTVCVNCTYSSLFPCICTECLKKLSPRIYSFPNFMGTLCNKDADDENFRASLGKFFCLRI